MNHTMRNLEFHIKELYTSIRYIRDQFGDDKCYEDWHKLFAMLPEGFTPPKQDVAVQLEHCERFLKCRAEGIEYIPPPRWVVGEADKEGLWIRQLVGGGQQLIYESNMDLALGHAAYSFGPIPESP